MKTLLAMLAFATVLGFQESASKGWPAPVMPAISQADGYVVIPNAAVAPDPGSIYRAIFDATRKSDDPKQILPALNMAGSELNAMAAAHVPPGNARFAVVFHGPA